MAQTTIKVSLVEDDAGYRATLRMLIDNEPGFRCASASANTKQALAEIPPAHPDVLLVDLELPDRSGIELIREIKKQQPQLPVMVLTQFENTERIFQSLQAGASGYVLKRTSLAKILEAIGELRDGGAPMTPQIARQVTDYFHARNTESSADDGLTPREREALRLVAQGARNQEIAQSLSISISTVRVHLRHIYEKLHVRSRTEAAARLLRRDS